MQNPLFADQPPPAPSETLGEIERDLRDKARSLPALAGEHFIFGTGDARADVVVVGESPGPPDAESGKPFMGPVGQLLEKILLAIGLQREECYLTNVVKYISQGDELTPDIIRFFTPFLEREILAVRPRVIISLGNTPTRALLSTKQPISKIRGEFRDFRGIKLMPTFNPAYLLRDPTKKREVWEDMKAVRDFLATSAE